VTPSELHALLIETRFKILSLVPESHQVQVACLLDENNGIILAFTDAMIADVKKRV
jgi:hypothetical protein